MKLAGTLANFLFKIRQGSFDLKIARIILLDLAMTSREYICMVVISTRAIAPKSILVDLA